MDDNVETRRTSKAGALLRALRPAVPAVISAAAMIFLFAAVMPLSWVAGISWNLYLDRLSDLFVPPVGNGGRLVLALGMALVAALIAGLVALVLVRPDSARRARRRGPGEAADDPLPRRRADFHPDDPPRPPIRAGRDLPAEGLGPVAWAADEPAVEEQAEEEEEALVLADLAPAVPEYEPEEGPEQESAPWLQPAEVAAQPLPDPADRSLGAMVARFEAGLVQRRRTQAATPSAAPALVDAANEDGAEDIDFALEAALSTLQRLNRNAAG